MNKISTFRRRLLPHVWSIFIFCALINSAPLPTAKADAAPPPDPTVGSVGPYQPIKTNVQMMSETVFIDVPQSPSNLQEPKQIRVNASFTMRNQGKTEEQMQVIFPLTRLNTGGSEEALYQIDTSSFVVKVKGKHVPFTIMTTPAEKIISGPDSEHGFSPEVKWAAFEVTFPVQKDVLLEVEYEMLNPYGEYGEGFTGIAYILETGAGWYGNILSADITLRLPYKVTEDAIRYANPGYVISGREMHWKLKDFEPARKDNLQVAVIHVDQWQVVLNLREKVERSPRDAESWAELADWYQQFSIFYNYGASNWPYYAMTPRLAELTLDARRKVVALRPEWGNAHFRLAQILWFTNPTVKERFSVPVGKAEYIQPDDPSIQEVLHELDLAWVYGFDGNVDSWNVEDFQQMISSAVPGVKLTMPTATATAIPSTPAFTPVPTNTAFPTALSTFAPTAAPTLIPTVTRTPIPNKDPSSISNNLLVIAVVAVTIGATMFVYGWKRKRER